MAAPKFESFSDFFPYYLAEHANPTCRRLHYIGTTLGTAVALYAVLTGQFAFLLLYPVIGYGFAWFAHFRYERNKPATFDYPRWSLMGDYKMLWLALTGKLQEPLMEGIKRHGKAAH